MGAHDACLAHDGLISGTITLRRLATKDWWGIFHFSSSFYCHTSGSIVYRLLHLYLLAVDCLRRDETMKTRYCRLARNYYYHPALLGRAACTCIYFWNWVGALVAAFDDRSRKRGGNGIFWILERDEIPNEDAWIYHTLLLLLLLLLHTCKS